MTIDTLSGQIRTHGYIDGFIKKHLEINHNERHTPTDSEMLDWLIKNEYTVFKLLTRDRYCVYFVSNESVGQYESTPRAAIAAEMAKENK